MKRKLTNIKPTEEQIAKWRARPFSWSQMSSFDYDPEQWYERYILNLPQPDSEEMKFGKYHGEAVAKDKRYLPFIKRHNKPEHPFMVKFGKLTLVGYGDFFCTKTKRKLQELKTGVKAWDQKRVDQHGQIDMYLLMHYITEKIKPEEMDIELIWLPTKREETGDFKVHISFVEPLKKTHKIFKTKRTMNDILTFGTRINDTYRAMEAYIALKKHS